MQEAGLPKIPPTNPAVSPKKGVGPQEEHPAAPACKTVLLPTLEEAKDLPTVPPDELADLSGRSSVQKHLRLLETYAMSPKHFLIS